MQLTLEADSFLLACVKVSRACAKVVSGVLFGLKGNRFFFDLWLIFINKARAALLPTVQPARSGRLLHRSLLLLGRVQLLLLVLLMLALLLLLLLVLLELLLLAVEVPLEELCALDGHLLQRARLLEQVRRACTPGGKDGRQGARQARKDCVARRTHPAR